MKSWLENPQKPKIGQNIKYDSHIFFKYGISLDGILHDTMIQSYVFESHKKHDLNSLALRWLNYKTITYEQICGQGSKKLNFKEVDIYEATEYAAEDAFVTFALNKVIYNKLKKSSKLSYIYHEIELPVLKVLVKIERNGVLINSQLLSKQSYDLANRSAELEKKAYELAGNSFNLNSPKQLGEILFQKLQLPIVKKTPSGAPSTDEAVLQKLSENFPLPKLLLNYRSLVKLKSTYTDKLPKMINLKTGRVHTNFSQANTVTGRLSSNDPNLQNIPIRNSDGRRIREAFIAPSKKLIISADYSQIELRIMAHLSGDQCMLEAFSLGDDIHRITASEIFGINVKEVSNEQRRHAKVINFGLMYGMSAYGLANNLNIDNNAAKNYIQNYFSRFSGVKSFMDDIRMQAKELGYVETLFGRRLWIPEINSNNVQKRNAAERAAINAPMQGTAADLIKLAMVSVQNWIDLSKVNSKIIMQVHDELVLEVKEDDSELVKQNLPKLMENVAKLKVPLIADVGLGNNWEKAH
tara:strand:+ start:12 stop:1583 length:1572 start_codon:yes stop_codon:yes gene_type:complete